MKKPIAVVFTAASLFAGAPAISLASTDVAAVCSGNVPSSWTRPGGFCDQNNFNNSISSDSSPYEGCPLVGSLDLEDIRMLVATPDDPCRPRCSSITEELMLQGMPRDRVLLTAC